VYVFELVHPVKASPSRLHSNVAAGSSAVNVNDADVLAVAPSGPVVIVVFGALVSTLTVTEFDAGEVLAAASIATAVYVWAPSATPVRALLQVPPPPVVVVPRDVAPSKTSTVALGSAVPESVMLPVLFVLPSAGLVIAGAAGGVTSTVQVRTAGVGSVLPAGSVALTSKVCPPSARALYVTPLVQDTKTPVSSLHSKLLPASLAVNVNVALVSLVAPKGPVAIAVSGAATSTTQA
jgi:hypothetical protein